MFIMHLPFDLISNVLWFKMEKKLKFAIIGCGGILEWAHLPGYIKMDNVEIVAFCDIIPERAEAIAKKYAAKKKLDTVPATYQNYKDVLAIPGLDAIDICTPNYLHSIIARKPPRPCQTHYFYANGSRAQKDRVALRFQALHQSYIPAETNRTFA